MRDKSAVLFSVDFRAHKGGISRVANLIGRTLKFRSVYSFYGMVSESTQHRRYFNGNLFRFIFFSNLLIFFKRPALIIFDHLGVASILFFIPGFFLDKVVIYLHDEEAWKPVTGRHRIALAKATHLICNSSYTLQAFLTCNPIFAGKTSVCMPAGVPEEFYKPEYFEATAYKDWIAQAIPYCIFVSRLWKEHRYKGYLNLVEAFAIAVRLKKDFNLKLAIIGKGDDKDYLENYVRQRGLQDMICVFDEVTDADLYSFYAHSAALTFPSSREGFGMVFLEAMFFGKACIGLRNQPAEEIIINNETGVLLSDNQPITISGVLLDIFQNPERYVGMGKKGKQLFQEKFTQDAFNKRFLEAIK